MAYSGLAQTYGYNAGTAVYASTTYDDAANAPCNLTVSSANQGSIYIEDASGAVIYQEPVPPTLYNFQNITFGTCGFSGYFFPSTEQCNTFYAQYGAWTSNTAFLSLSLGVQAWTVPSTAEYRYTWCCLQSSMCLAKGCHALTCRFQRARRFMVAGASGGGSTGTGSATGGLGALVSGSVHLAAGSTVYVLVGQTPQSTYNSPGTTGYGGGGGGSYVFLNDLETPLLVAGGLTRAHAPHEVHVLAASAAPRGCTPAQVQACNSKERVAYKFLALNWAPTHPPTPPPTAQDHQAPSPSVLTLPRWRRR